MKNQAQLARILLEQSRGAQTGTEARTDSRKRYRLHTLRQFYTSHNVKQSSTQVVLQWLQKQTEPSFISSDFHSYVSTCPGCVHYKVRASHRPSSSKCLSHKSSFRNQTVSTQILQEATTEQL